MSSGWVVCQVGGAKMTDGGGGENRCRKEKKVNRKNISRNKQVMSCLVSTKGEEPQTDPWEFSPGHRRGQRPFHSDCEQFVADSLHCCSLLLASAAEGHLLIVDDSMLRFSAV